MSKNPTHATLVEAADRKDAGESWKAILADTGLNYSQAWYHWARRTLEANAPTLLIAPADTLTGLGRQVAEARHGGDGSNLEAHATTPTGLEWATSWGGIAVRCNLPETRVRKAYEEHTGVRTDGQRKAKGGRFVRDDPNYYVDEARRVGVRTPKGQGHAYPTPTSPADVLNKQAPAQLRSLLRQAGVPVPKGAKKATLVQMVLDAADAAQAEREAAASK